MGASTSTLRELVVAGNLQALKNAVAEHGEQTVNYELDSYSTTCLMLASRQFRPKIVAYLCEAGADMAKQDYNGWTALHWASAAGDVGAAAALLDSGADSSQRDVLGRLPRHLLELAVCDASIDEIRERLFENELQTHGEATHSLAVPATVYAGKPGARIVVEVRAPEHHDESDYVQLYVERLIQGQLNLSPPTPAQATSAMLHNLMPRLGSYRYVARGWRSVVVFDSENMEVGLRLRAVYVRADGEVVLASDAFVTTLAPLGTGDGQPEPEWQLFISKSTGARYYVNTNTGESVDKLPEGTPFGTDNVEGSTDDDDFEDEQNELETQSEENKRAELSGLKLSELKKRARAAGVPQDALDAADDLADSKAAVIELMVALTPTADDATATDDAQVPVVHGTVSTSTPVSSPAPVDQEPEPEQEVNPNGVAMTPEQVEFRSHLNEFRNIAADLGHAVLSEGQEAWDLEEAKDLVWSHATMELSEHEARGGQPTSMDWLLNGWTEESAALGTAVRPPFDRWCPTTMPGVPMPSPTPPESTAAAAAETAMRAKILQISSPKNDAVTKQELQLETADLAEFLAKWNMGEYLPTALVALAVDPELQNCRYRLVRKKFTDDMFWRSYAFQVERIVSQFAAVAAKSGDARQVTSSTGSSKE